MITNQPTPPDPDKITKAEAAKRDSKHLRGTIEDVLADPDAVAFEDHDLASLKFHGVYQQDDRDTRIQRRKQGLEKDYSFMIRIGLPGGRCSAAQYLAMDDLAGTYASGSLRLTTRQAFQLHGVIKSNLRTTMRSINEALMCTLSACGDIPRNVMAAPAPFADEIHHGVQIMAHQLAAALRPGTGAYHEIWLDGEKVLTTENEEPFYGEQYLPRKYKLGVAIDTDNSVDAYTYDTGLVAITENGAILGYNIIAGGGMGITHNKPETYARIGSPICFVPTEHAVETVRAIVAIYRDYGDRQNRKHARLKYIVEEWGVESFRAAIRERVDFEIHPPARLPTPKQLDHLGRFEQGDGKEFLGVYIQNGRIRDDDQSRIRTAFRRIAEELEPTMIITPMQSMLLADLEPAHVDRAIEILREHDVDLVESISNARRYAMACPALPTCGLALAESERVQPDLIAGFEAEFERLGLENVELTIRMTGCPNGCARPYNADIGIVGRKPGVYHVFVGGGLRGDRLADLYAADVKFDDIIPTLRPLFERFRTERSGDEGLSDFYRRAIADDDERTILTGREEPAVERYSLPVLPS